MSKVRITFWTSSLLWLPKYSHAEASPSQGFTSPLPIISVESMLQLLAGLFVVLAFIILIAWLFKKIGFYPAQRTDLLKIISSASVGQKERIVIAEINDTWLVLGVAPGQVNLLHQTNRKMTVNNTAADSPSFDSSFNEKLQANLEQNHEYRDNIKPISAESK